MANAQQTIGNFICMSNGKLQAMFACHHAYKCKIPSFVDFQKVDWNANEYQTLCCMKCLVDYTELAFQS